MGSLFFHHLMSLLATIALGAGTSAPAGTPAGPVVLRVVGSVRGATITTRDVQLDRLLTRVLEEGDKATPAPLPPADSSEMGLWAGQLLRERCVFLETRELSLSELGPRELETNLATARAALARSPAYKALEVSDAELQEALRQKLKAAKFIRFKRESAATPITDAEAQKYFNENRSKFGPNSEFEEYRESIRSLLGRQVVDRRLQDWYGIVLRKHEARNLLSDL